MRSHQGMTAGIAAAIEDLLDYARVEKGHEVLLMAHIDGLYGSDNLVDEQAMDWIQSAIRRRGANAALMWVDAPDKPHAWKLPKMVAAAMKGCDIFINHSFTLVTEDIRPLRDYFTDLNIRYVRNFATTAPLLNTPWAQTPLKLVAEIRYQASKMITVDAGWELTEPNGTRLVGIIDKPQHRWFPTYACYREEGGGYLPWPEWVFPPVYLKETNGVLVFEQMLSWWSRYIGIAPYFKTPVVITIENNRIKAIEGGAEADALRNFLKFMEPKIGPALYDFHCLHGGTHPQAIVGPQQCPNANYRRMIEHSHCRNLHAHIGSECTSEDYPYWLHVTGDIRNPTWKVGDAYIYKNGRLTALETPEVLAVAAQYPGRPGLEPVPWQY